VKRATRQWPQTVPPYRDGGEDKGDWLGEEENGTEVARDAKVHEAAGRTA
jgi:hypothetical protein